MWKVSTCRAAAGPCRAARPAFVGRQDRSHANERAVVSEKAVVEMPEDVAAISCPAEADIFSKS